MRNGTGLSRAVGWSLSRVEWFVVVVGPLVVEGVSSVLGFESCTSALSLVVV
jgi:hypothetical protein